MIIYYFSGTTNSFKVSKELANCFSADLISIATLNDFESITPKGNSFGIVFPTYHASYGFDGIPTIVRSFIKKLKAIENHYIFSVVTHSGMPWNTVGNLELLIQSQGGTLSSGFNVKLGNPFSPFEKLAYFLFHKPLKPNENSEKSTRDKLEKEWHNRKILIAQIVQSKSSHIEKPSPLKLKLFNGLIQSSKRPAIARYEKLAGDTFDSFDQLCENADRAFSVSGDCSGCGTCIKICPVKNIALVNNTPHWQHHCLNCYACYVWCPSSAIGGEIVQFEKKYTQPDISLTEALESLTETVK